MTTEEVIKLVESRGHTFGEFTKWMFGQTYGMNPDGTPNWYEVDVNRFINGLRVYD